MCSALRIQDCLCFHMDLLATIELIPFWAWLTAGVLLILIDALATNTVYFGCLGASLLVIGLLDAIGFSGLIQAITLPVIFPLVAWQVPRQIKPFMAGRQVEPIIEDLIGTTGSVIDPPSQSGEYRAHFTSHGDWQIRVRGDVVLHPGDLVHVIDREGLVLIVERAG